MKSSLRAVAFAASVALIGLASLAAPASAQSIAVQYRDYPRFDRDYEDRDYGDRDYGDRGDYDDDYDDNRRQRFERRRDQRRHFEERRERRGEYRLNRHDIACLRAHKSYDPRSGTFRDGHGGRKRCRL